MDAPRWAPEEVKRAASDRKEGDVGVCGLIRQARTRELFNEFFRPPAVSQNPREPEPSSLGRSVYELTWIPFAPSQKALINIQ